MERTLALLKTTTPYATIGGRFPVFQIRWTLHKQGYGTAKHPQHHDRHRQSLHQAPTAGTVKSDPTSTEYLHGRPSKISRLPQASRKLPMRLLLLCFKVRSTTPEMLYIYCWKHLVGLETYIGKLLRREKLVRQVHQRKPGLACPTQMETSIGPEISHDRQIRKTTSAI